MTAREQLNRRKRWVNVSLFACVGLIFAAVFGGGALFGRPQPAVFLAVFGVLIAFAGVSRFGLFRCPRCRGNLAPLVMGRGGFSIDKKLAFCPYCGVGLDDELGDDAGPPDRDRDRDRDDRW